MPLPAAVRSATRSDGGLVGGLCSVVMARLCIHQGDDTGAGVFSRGIAPVDLYVSVAGISHFFFSNRLTLSSIFGRDPGRSAALRVYRRRLVTLGIAVLRRYQPDG
ncbi:MAG TPA: hypothetical protein VIT02_07070 [Burkholderiaceae bacterium]